MHSQKGKNNAKMRGAKLCTYLGSIRLPLQFYPKDETIPTLQGGRIDTGAGVGRVSSAISIFGTA